VGEVREVEWSEAKLCEMVWNEAKFSEVNRSEVKIEGLVNV
jgi:hypothetical protein